MSFHKPRALQHRSGFIPFSGSVVESNPTPTASVLMQNSQAVDDSGVTTTSVSYDSSSLSPQPTSSTNSTNSTNTSTSSHNQIPLATVIGACVAAFVALILAVLFALYCLRRQKQPAGHSKSRNLANDFSRSRSHLEPWKRMSDDLATQPQERSRSMKQRRSSGPLGAMFQRTLSTGSGEKSWEGHNRESVGTMRNFAKYHPGLAAEMASSRRGDVLDADGNVVKPPPIHHLAGRGPDMAPGMSWDGDTVGGHSLLSLHSGSQSPMMAMAKATPPATTTSSPHHWETAEVVHIGPEFSRHVELQNPFEDSASSVKSSKRSASTRGQNPFFSSGRDHRSIRRPAPPEIPQNPNPFSDSNSNSPNDADFAIQSLIAALEEPMSSGRGDRILSLQSSVYSHMTGTTIDDRDSAVSVNVTAFPYPPTRIDVS